jgi:hypothetical protein
MIEALSCLKSCYKLKEWKKLESLLFISYIIQLIYSVDDDDKKGVLM